jgi:hypothetical protein
MDEHNARIERITPAARFHTMELSEGWAPLCKALGKPIPDEPFPRVNDAEAVGNLAGQILQEVGLIWALIILTAGLVGWGGYYFLR